MCRQASLKSLGQQKPVRSATKSWIRREAIGNDLSEDFACGQTIESYGVDRAKCGPDAHGGGHQEHQQKKSLNGLKLARGPMRRGERSMPHWNEAHAQHQDGANKGHACQSTREHHPYILRWNSICQDREATPVETEGLFSNNDVEKRAPDSEFTVIINETESTKLVHEVVDMGPRRPNHIGESLLRYLRNVRFVVHFTAKAS
jgi:hypothetical protein